MHLNFITNTPRIFIGRRVFCFKDTKLNREKKNSYSITAMSCQKTKSSLLCIEKFPSRMISGLISFVLFFGSVNVFAVLDETPKTSVLDESGTLTKSSIAYIEKSLAKIKETKQTEVYFVSIRNLPYGKDPKEYAKDLFQKWNLGENDVVVVLVNKLAKAGVYQGGQVSVLTDEIVQSISNETYTFKAKDEQYSSAALDVNNRLVSLLSGKGDSGAPSLIRSTDSSNFKTAKKTEESRSKYIAIIAVLLVIAFVVPMVQFFYYVKDE